MAGNARLAVDHSCGVLGEPQQCAFADVGGLACREGVVAQHGVGAFGAVGELSADSEGPQNLYLAHATGGRSCL
jgi:hypothetical protein